MIPCCWFEQEFNRVNYPCSVGALEALTGVCVCLWGPKVEFPLCLWPDEEGKWCTCLPVFACTLPPVAKTNQSLLSITPVWFLIQHSPKKGKTTQSQQWIRVLNPRPVVQRSQLVLVAARHADSTGSGVNNRASVYVQEENENFKSSEIHPSKTVEGLNVGRRFAIEILLTFITFDRTESGVAAGWREFLLISFKSWKQLLRLLKE